MTSAAMDMPSTCTAEAELPSLTDRLAVCAGLWTTANSATLARLGAMVVNDGGFFSRVGAGTSTTTKTLERFARFLINADNWPEELVPQEVCRFAHFVGVSGSACLPSPDIAAEIIGAPAAINPVPAPDAAQTSGAGPTPAASCEEAAGPSAVPVPRRVAPKLPGAGAADEHLTEAAQ